MFAGGFASSELAILRFCAHSSQSRDTVSVGEYSFQYWSQRCLTRRVVAKRWRHLSLSFSSLLFFLLVACESNFNETTLAAYARFTHDATGGNGENFEAKSEMLNACRVAADLCAACVFRLLSKITVGTARLAAGSS